VINIIFQIYIPLCGHVELWILPPHTPYKVAAPPTPPLSFLPAIFLVSPVVFFVTNQAGVFAWFVLAPIEETFMSTQEIWF
jgi:hypothetical protein